MKDKTYIDGLFKRLAQTRGASDLIITVGKPPQIRVNSELAPIGEEKLTSAGTTQICTSLLSEEQIQRFEKEKEFDFSYHLDGVGRFRINVYYQRSSMALAARIIPHQIPSFEELGLPPILRELAMLSQGLVLVTGPVGSGKSTTLAAMIDHINKIRRCHIICVEDPIEYLHEHMLSTIDQREVGNDTASFAEALRRVLRQSLDVVLVGEIRDRQSAQAAMTLAETGHLTLATLHTRGTVASANRLIDMFPPEQNYQIKMQLASALGGVVWQQLIPTVNKDRLVLACEIMTATPAVRSLIRKGRTQELYSVIQSGKQYGMQTMQDAIEELLEENLIDEMWGNHDLVEIHSMSE